MSGLEPPPPPDYESRRTEWAHYKSMPCLTYNIDMKPGETLKIAGCILQWLRFSDVKHYM
jgi:hypothetical protein